MPAFYTLFMPGARPGQTGKQSVGVTHFPAWLEAELKKGREFGPLVKIFIQTTHVCTLDGTPVILRGELTYSRARPARTSG